MKEKSFITLTPGWRHRQKCQSRFFTTPNGRQNRRRQCSNVAKCDRFITKLTRRRIRSRRNF